MKKWGSLRTNPALCPALQCLLRPTHMTKVNPLCPRRRLGCSSSKTSAKRCGDVLDLYLCLRSDVMWQTSRSSPCTITQSHNFLIPHRIPTKVAKHTARFPHGSVSATEAAGTRQRMFLLHTVHVPIPHDRSSCFDSPDESIARSPCGC